MASLVELLTLYSMPKKTFIFALLIVTASCSIKKKFKELVALRTDLISTFDHENIII